MANDLTQATQLVFDKLASLSDKYSSDATHIAMMAVQADGIQSLVIGTVFFILALALAIFSWKTWRHTDWEHSTDYNSVFGALSVISFICACVSIVILCNVWNWMAVFNPPVYLAHKIITSVLS